MDKDVFFFEEKREERRKKEYTRQHKKNSEIDTVSSHNKYIAIK